MQLSYQDRGMQCDFTLMTIGDYRGGSATPAPATARQPSVTAAVERPPSRQMSAAVTPAHVASAVRMPPPSEPASRSFTRDPPQSQRIQRPSPPPPKRSMNHESLFLPADEDEDRQWGERNYDEDEDTIGWSASAHNLVRYLIGLPAQTVSDNFLKTRSFGNSRNEQDSAPRLEPYPAWPEDLQTRLAPTQRLSNVKFLAKRSLCELTYSQIENLFDAE